MSAPVVILKECPFCAFTVSPTIAAVSSQRAAAAAFSTCLELVRRFGVDRTLGSLCGPHRHSYDTAVGPIGVRAAKDIR